MPQNKPEPEKGGQSITPDRPTDVDQNQKAEPVEIPQIQKEDRAEFAACLAELHKRDVGFEETPAIQGVNGCGMDRPITVSSLGLGISLNPRGQMRCKTALKLTEWVAHSVIPALQAAMPKEELASINQASAYVCRNRNGAQNGGISAHAHGNAIDVAGFTFRSGKSFSIEPRMRDATMDGAFQRAITSAACLYFTTVLDPGSDAAHETHLHLDILKRNGGYRYCW